MNEKTKQRAGKALVALVLLIALSGCRTGLTAHGSGTGSTYIHINKITDKIYQIREL